MPSANQHCFGKRHRQRCSDGVTLPGAFSHVGQQAQYNLPVFIPAAGAIARDAVMALCCAVPPSGLGQQDQYQLAMCILPARALPALRMMALRCLVLSVMSDSRPRAGCQSALFRQAPSPAMQ